MPEASILLFLVISGMPAILLAFKLDSIHFDWFTVIKRGEYADQSAEAIWVFPSKIIPRSNKYFFISISPRPKIKDTVRGRTLLNT